LLFFLLCCIVSFWVFFLLLFFFILKKYISHILNFLFVTEIIFFLHNCINLPQR
jgi:hypothetical protein